ncbi:MAG TPA: arginine repressor [Lachnospiraceae bacterium]|nr:arginine repressor [Lachnospiraceae bacterium]
MKNARHEQILLLIEQYEIETQEELAERLTEAGFTVTQATVSRDIRQLQLRKVTSSSGKLRYTVGSVGNADLSQKYKRVLEDAFVSAEYAGNLVVIRTVSGMAMAAAAAIDSLDWREVLGCIAGDDTIMVAVRTEEAAPEIIGRIRSIARTH